MTAPNHEEAKLLGVRFRHVHRTRNLARVQKKLDGTILTPVQKELAGTIVTVPDGEDRVKCSLIVLNPHDARPRKYDQRDLAIMDLLAVVEQFLGEANTLDLFGDVAAPYLTNAQTRPNVSRQEGRRRVWERHLAGKSVSLSIKFFKELLVEGTLAKHLALRLGYPTKVVASLEGVR